MKRASGGLKKAIAVSYFTGLRKKDVVEALEGERAAGVIERLSSKPGVSITVFEAKRLTEILDVDPQTDDGEPSRSLVTTRSGAAYTRGGLDTMFHRLKVKLVEEDLIRPA